MTISLHLSMLRCFESFVFYYLALSHLSKLTMFAHNSAEREKALGGKEEGRLVATVLILLTSEL